MTYYSNWARFNDKWTRYSVVHSEDLLSNDAKADNTILMIPGNPGNDNYYIDFATKVVNLWKKNCQVFIVSHLNHVPLPHGLVKIDGHQLSRKFCTTFLPSYSLERFNLEDQINHAVQFVDEIVRPKMTNKTIRIIGHSIGAYIGASIKPLLKHDGFDVHLIGLFPTFTHMAQTPAGLRIKPYVNFVSNYEKLVRVLLWGLKWIPIELKRLLVRCCIRHSTTATVTQAAAELIDSLVFRNVTFMASDELKVVNELQPKMKIELSSDDVHLYYGLTDHWAPLSYAHAMESLIGKDRVTFDDTGADHAFVLRSSDIIAERVVTLFLN